MVIAKRSHAATCAIKPGPERLRAFEGAWLRLEHSTTLARWQSIRASAERDPEASEFLELEPDAFIIDGETVELRPLAAPLLWAACLVDCNVGARAVQSRDFYFSDLAAVSATPVELVGTLRSWAAIVDVESQRRAALPWWLSSAAQLRTWSVGLLDPWLVGQLALARVALEPWLARTLDVEDTAALFEVVERTADSRDWLVGTEPGT